MSARSNDSAVLRLYEKYEHLATNYAKQIFEYDKLGYEFGDLVQEFKIKIYTSIIAYTEKWQLYKATNRYKPVPLELYIKCALNNKSKDYIKAIQATPYTAISIEAGGFDYAYTNSIDSRLVIDAKGCMLEINGIDVLADLPYNVHTRSNRHAQQCFLLYLKGHPLRKLQKMFRNHFDATQLVNTHVEYLQQFANELTENVTATYFNYTTPEPEAV